MALLPEKTLKKAALPYLSDRKEVRDYVDEAFSMIPKPQFIAIWNAVTIARAAPKGLRDIFLSPCR